MRTHRFLSVMLAALFVAGPAAVVCGQAATDATTDATTDVADAAASETPTTAADEAAIRANAEKFVEAYNRRDAKSMAAMWSPEAVYMDPATDEAIIGRDALAKQFDEDFAGAEDAKLAINIVSIDFVSPNVAIERGTAEVTYQDHEPETSEYTAVHVKREGLWLLDRVTESEIAPPPGPSPSHYEQLKELEWMVGSWIDQDEIATIQTDCEWTKNKNFLTRSFAVVAGDQVGMSGMQIVAWDPAAKQIRSWVFDSDGTFGEGKWTRKDNRWLVQQVGTLPDGKKTSVTNIITPVDDNSYTWQSINRESDGEVMPNIEEVLIVRSPEEGIVAVDIEAVVDTPASEAAEPPVEEPAAASTEEPAGERPKAAE